MRIRMRLVHALCALALAAGPVDAAAKKTTSNAAAAKRSRAAQMRERGLAAVAAAYRQYLEKEKRPTEQKWVQRANERIAELQPQADMEEQAAAALAVTAPPQSPTAPSTPPPTSPSSPTPTPTAPEAAASPARTI